MLNAAIGNHRKRVRLVAAKEISVDAAVAAVSTKFDGLFTLKEAQRMALKAFLSEKDVFALLPNGFGKSVLQFFIGGNTHLMSDFGTIGSLELLLLRFTQLSPRLPFPKSFPRTLYYKV